MHLLSHPSGVIYEWSQRFNLAPNKKLDEFAHGARLTFEVLKSSQNYPILQEFEIEKVTICASPAPLSGLNFKNDNFIYRSVFVHENAYIYCKYHFRSCSMFLSDDDEIPDLENMFSSDDDIPDFEN